MTKAERFSVIALGLLVVGLALHNAAMAQLWQVGVRGNALDAFAAWKEVLLLVALVVVGWNVRRLPAVRAADVLALAYAVVIVVYLLLPDGWLDSGATTRGELFALRHHLLPVAGYGLGRLVGEAWGRRWSLANLVVLTALGIAVVGLLDLGLLSLQAWRESGVPGWYREQLGLEYEGLSGLPENWVYNTGDEENPIRRLVSTFLSPLASAYVLVIALIYVLSRPFRVWWGAAALVLYGALLYTHTRAAFAALAVGLVVLALAQRRAAPAVLAVATAGVGAAFLLAYPSIGPSTSYTSEELEWLRENAEQSPGVSSDPFSPNESSAASHWRNLREGIREVWETPRGYGLGNAGVAAKRTGVEIRGGESTFVELGIDAGAAGLAAFVLWSLALLHGLWRREAWLVAAFASLLFLGLQTDIIGVHWLAVTVWAAAGLVLTGPVERRGVVGDGAGRGGETEEREHPDVP